MLSRIPTPFIYPRDHQCDDSSPRDNDGAEVDVLRLPLKKKLSALADLPEHIVTFRGHLARLTTAGQAPLALDAYRLFLASLSPFPVFLQYTMLWTVANGAIGQQTFKAISSPTPTFDPSLATSKGLRTERAKMKA